MTDIGTGSLLFATHLLDRFDDFPKRSTLAGSIFSRYRHAYRHRGFPMLTFRWLGPTIEENFQESEDPVFLPNFLPQLRAPFHKTSRMGTERSHNLEFATRGELYEHLEHSPLKRYEAVQDNTSADRPHFSSLGERTFDRQTSPQLFRKAIAAAPPAQSGTQHHSKESNSSVAKSFAPVTADIWSNPGFQQTAVSRTKTSVTEMPKLIRRTPYFPVSPLTTLRLTRVSPQETSILAPILDGRETPNSVRHSLNSIATANSGMPPSIASWSAETWMQPNRSSPVSALPVGIFQETPALPVFDGYSRSLDLTLRVPQTAVGTSMAAELSAERVGVATQARAVSQNPPISQQSEIAQRQPSVSEIADRVYRILERRIVIEKERRGIF